MKKNATGSRQTLHTTMNVHICLCMTGAPGWCECACHEADERAADELLSGSGSLCGCGKPASHLDADPDVHEGTWACLMPNFNPATGEHLPPVGKYAPAEPAPALDPIQIVTMERMHGRDYTWFEDLRIVGLSSDLDQAGRERALAELASSLQAA